MKCYRSYDIEEQLGLTQDHLIAMALILGCDYGLVGIKGIGKERTLEMLQSWPGCNPLQKSVSALLLFL
jgi:5'-3' exonuclease